MDSNLTFNPDDQLAETLEAAVVTGSGANLERFFSKLFNSTLYVPERQQVYPLSNKPQYPNDLVHVLGIQDRERVIVPVFSSPEYIELWSGNTFNYHTLNLSALCGKIPENWWFVLNPGFSVEKEFSPWEIEQIKLGSESIKELVAENTEDLVSSEPIEIKPELFEDKPKLKSELLDYFMKNPAISSCHIVKEVVLAEQEQINKIKVGVFYNPDKTQTDIKELKIEIQNIIAQYFIGAEELSIYIFNANKPLESGPLQGLFQNSRAFYETKNTDSSLIGKMFSGVKKLLNP